MIIRESPCFPASQRAAVSAEAEDGIDAMAPEHDVHAAETVSDEAADAHPQAVRLSAPSPARASAAGWRWNATSPSKTVTRATVERARASDSTATSVISPQTSTASCSSRAPSHPYGSGVTARPRCDHLTKRRGHPWLPAHICRSTRKIMANGFRSLLRSLMLPLRSDFMTD
jgi:hypothetical protein